MPQKNVALVLIDITGFTKFTVATRTAVLHAQEIIFSLLESIVEKSEHPLVLNKLEGDAVLMYADLGNTPADVAERVLNQVVGCFSLFHARTAAISQDRTSCVCSACRNISSLRLKVILHHGTVVFRQVRQFEEIAGEDVIIAHRLLKNSVPHSEYVLMTEAFHGMLLSSRRSEGEKRVEEYEELGQVPIRVFAQ